MWGVKGGLFIRPQSNGKEDFPFSAIPSLGATEVEGGGARPLKFPLWALLWACPLGKWAFFFFFFAGTEAGTSSQTGMLQFFPKP